MAAMQLHWDIFCRVIDNFGDIGVCWRLARQLAAEHGKRVRLWVDDLHCLQPLCPDVDAALATQHQQGVEICQWTDSIEADRVGEVVIEAFACELPPVWLQAMATAKPKPCWINLEYLTAEPWAESCHGMASPHPSLPLVKYFYFPGFSPGSGGLLRERALFARQEDAPSSRTGLDISLFCYDTAPVGALLDVLAASTTPVRLHVAPGKPLAAVASQLGGSGPWQRGELNVIPFDFLPQDEYDHLLRHCDINFVRGEDSFVRAQWADRPFVWQIYEQADAAHLVKLEAFLQRYTAGFGPATAEALCAIFRAWNAVGDLAPAWRQFLDRQTEIDVGNRSWTKNLGKNEDLASSLVEFCASTV